MNEYENMRCVVYADGMTFVPVCKQCGRFVRADTVVYEQGNTLHEQGNTLQPGPNATCAKCGRTEMLFEGYY